MGYLEYSTGEITKYINNDPPSPTFTERLEDKESREMVRKYLKVVTASRIKK